MSSACVCHTDEWCFYCNMYTPLEKKVESQQALIDQQAQEIEELKKKNDNVHAWREKSAGELNLAIKALEWYADDENHRWQEKEDDVFFPPWTNTLNDKGDIAKSFLAQIRGEKTS